uniref:Uncharacterized protein n=1 Tax=Geladintestivirus 2 TaxID=3233134 RepID=A0AAU8MHT0_9CAUD
MAYISKYTGKQFDEAIGKVGTLETTVASKADASVVTALSAEVKKKEEVANKVTSVSALSTDTQYPSAKALYTIVNNAETALGARLNLLENWKNQYPNDVDSSLSAKEDSANKTTKVDSTATDTQYPTAKAVYTAINSLQGSSSESITSVSNRVGTLEGLTIKKVTTGLADTVQDAWQLVDGNGKTYGVTIQTYKDRSVESVALDGQNLNITYNLANGTQSTVAVPLSSFVTESEFNSKTGFSVSNGVVSLNLSTNETSSKYLSFDVNGKLQVTGVDGKLLGSHNVTNANIASSTITNAELALGSVDENILAEGAVTASRIANGHVTEAKLATSAVSTTKIKDASVTHAKLASDVYDTTLAKTGYAADAKTVGDKITSVSDNVGTLADLTTSDKTTLVAAINSLVTRCNSLSTSLTRAIEKIHTLENTNFIVAREEVVETTLIAPVQMPDDDVFDQSDTTTILRLADPTIFKVGDKLTAVGVKGYEPNNSVSTNDLILVVKELVSEVGVKVATTNGFNSGGITNIVPNIPRNTIIRLITE